jgi:ATP:ADP antiporter, AAA family
LPDLVKIAGKVKGLHSTAFLLDQLVLRGVSPDRIIQSLWLKEYESPDKHKKGILLDILKQYMTRATEKINYYFSCSDHEDQVLLKRSISSEVRSDLLCILRICSMLFDRKEVNRLIELIDVEKKTKLFNAMEMMDLMIPKKLSIQLNLLFDFLLDTEHMIKRVEKLDPRQLYEEIVFDNHAGFSAWTRAVCIFDSWKHSEKSIISRLPAATFADNSYILEETRKHVLKNVFS